MTTKRRFKDPAMQAIYEHAMQTPPRTDRGQNGVRGAYERGASGLRAMYPRNTPAYAFWRAGRDAAK